MNLSIAARSIILHLLALTRQLQGLPCMENGSYRFRQYYLMQLKMKNIKRLYKRISGTACKKDIQKAYHNLMKYMMSLKTSFIRVQAGSL